jgi:hypothetical protein
LIANRRVEKYLSEYSQSFWGGHLPSVRAAIRPWNLKEIAIATRTRLPARFAAPILTLTTVCLVTFAAAPAHAADPIPTVSVPAGPPAPGMPGAPTGLGATLYWLLGPDGVVTKLNKSLGGLLGAPTG